jgi:hypothetical protein
VRSQRTGHEQSDTLAKNWEQGAQTTLHCVLTDDNVNGKYYMDCREQPWIVGRSVGNETVEKTIFERTKKMLKLS